MAQPQQQQQFPPARSYVSPHTTPSPVPGATPGFNPPPQKRAQVSPTSPASPYPPLNSPPVNGSNVPPFQTNPYHTQGSNPYPLPVSRQMSPTQPSVRQTPPPLQQQTPAPAPQSQSQPQIQPQSMQQPGQSVMGPPPNKPDDDKPMDLNDIQDVMTGAGVDLKAEEAALIYDGARKQQSTSGPPQGYFDPQRNTWQANVPGSRDSLYGAGPFNQPASSVEPTQLEEELEAREKLMIRRRNERDQYHSNNPFLQNRIVLQKLNSAGRKSQTRIPTDGVYHPQQPITTKLIINGPEGHERIATLTKEPLLSLSSPMVDVLSLVSLACRERLRAVLEDSTALARGRRLTASGIVPPDFQDIAVGEGSSSRTTAEPLPLIGSDNPESESRKRSHSRMDEQSEAGKTSNTVEQQESIPTIAFPNLVVQALQRQAEQDAAFERERLAKRQKRQTASLVSGSDPASRAGSIPGTPDAGTPGPVDGIAPEAKITKKEQKRREDERIALSAAKDTKNAVNMALGGGLKFSWMRGKGGAGGAAGKKQPTAAAAQAKAKREDAPANPNAKTLATATAASSSPAAAAAAAPASMPKPGATVRGNRVLGSFREDREDGKGIQMRDLIAVLKDGPDKKTLSKSYGRQR